jgi:SAM-dependent methyltransferase
LRDFPEGDDLGLGPESFDAVLDILDLHAVDDVPGRLAQIRRALRPDGLFLGCLFAGATLGELRQAWLAAELEMTGGATPRVAPMIDVRELGALLQRAGFALPVADVDRFTVRYDDALALMREIAGLGMSNVLAARSRRPVTRGLLAAAARHYQANFADPDGRIRATVEIAWATGWAPHESQPRPLKPGSAAARLADALGVREEKLKADRSDGE